MDEKRITLRVPLEVYEEITKKVLESVDAAGYRHLSLNTWILWAIVEKIEREKPNG